MAKKTTKKDEKPKKPKAKKAQTKKKKRPSPTKTQLNGKDVILTSEPEKLSKPSDDKWRDEYYLMVFQFAKQGLAEKTMAERLKVNLPTFRRWCSERPAMTIAIKNGKEQSAVGRWEHLKKEQRAFLIAYCRVGNVSEACRATGFDRKRHYRTLRNEAGKELSVEEMETSYTRAFKEAEDEAADMLVSEARRRAIDGVRKHKFHQGVPIMVPCMPNDPDSIEATDLKGDTCYIKPYVEHEYSDTLLIFLLKGSRPEVYRDQQPIKLEQTTTINLSQLVQELENQPSTVINADYIRKAAEQTLIAHKEK